MKNYFFSPLIQLLFLSFLGCNSNDDGTVTGYIKSEDNFNILLDEGQTYFNNIIKEIHAPNLITLKENASIEETNYLTPKWESSSLLETIDRYILQVPLYETSSFTKINLINQFWDINEFKYKIKAGLYSLKSILLIYKNKEDQSITWQIENSFDSNHIDSRVGKFRIISDHKGKCTSFMSENEHLITLDKNIINEHENQTVEFISLIFNSYQISFALSNSLPSIYTESPYNSSTKSIILDNFMNCSIHTNIFYQGTSFCPKCNEQKTCSKHGKYSWIYPSCPICSGDTTNYYNTYKAKECKLHNIICYIKANETIEKTCPICAQGRNNKPFKIDCSKWDNESLIQFKPTNICNQFYTCYEGEPVIMTCPDGLQFDPSREICDYIEIVRCCDNEVDHYYHRCPCY